MAWLLLGEWWQEATGTGKAIPEVAVDQDLEMAAGGTEETLSIP